VHQRAIVVTGGEFVIRLDCLIKVCDRVLEISLLIISKSAVIEDQRELLSSVSVRLYQRRTTKYSLFGVGYLLACASIYFLLNLSMRESHAGQVCSQNCWPDTNLFESRPA